MRKFLSLLAVLVLLGSLAFSQSKVVIGKVTDQAGQPIPFATIRVKGTKIGTSADAEGNFSIKATPSQTLVISGTGIASKEALVGDGTALNIQVQRTATSLSEVVVTSLGIQRQAKELGYSTAKVSSRDLNQAAVIDVSTGLQGKVSGLQINLTSNSVAPSTRIVLRGNRSITGNNQALLILDGVPVDDPAYITKINPEDVDNVTVLKGAVAAAIYGSKASNGVIVITTKHGGRGKPYVTVSNTTTAEHISYMPKFQNTFGGYGGEGGYTNANGTVEYVPYENQSYGPRFTGKLEPLGLGIPVTNPDGTFDLNKLDTNFVPYAAISNNREKFFVTGITNQFDVGYSSGDEKGGLYIGFQDVNVGGVVPGDASRRDNVRIGGTRNYGNFKAEYTFSYNQQHIDIAGLSYNQVNAGNGTAGTGGVFSGRPLYFEVVNNPANVPLTSFKDWQNNMFATPNGYFDAYATNPYWTTSNSRRKTNTSDLIGNLALSYKILDWLNLSDRFGLTQTTATKLYTRAGITFAPWAIADPWGAGNIPSSQVYLAPSVYNESFFEQRLNNDLILQMNKEFGDFSVRALVGWNLAQRYQTDMYLEGDNLQFPGFYNISSVLGTPFYGQTSYKQRETSLYEEVTLGYKDFLYLHVTNRDEWNSILDPNNNHFEYPGADLTFIFTQGIESLKNSRILSFGKIRGGYTQVANINLGGNPYGAYELVNPFVPTTGFPFGAIGGYNQSTTYLNPLIRPETTDEWEVGGELGFLNGRINISGAYYNSQTKNQSLTAAISAATGFGQKVVNAGLVTNTGYELDLAVTVVKTKDVTWQVGANYSHFHNIINELLPGVNELQLSNFANGTAGVAGGIYAVKGQPYPVLKTTDWIRAPNGKVIVDPITGYPTVGSDENVYGNTNPTDILGLTTSVSYKGFTLNIVTDYRSGNYIMNSIGQNQDFTGVSAHSAENGRERFIFPNSVIETSSGKFVDNTTVAVSNGGNIGGAGFWPTVYTSGIGTPYITSAAFWKLREVSLVYQIPARVLASVSFIKAAQIGIVGRNLLMFRPGSNIWTDPEFSDNSLQGIGANNTGTGNAIGSTSEFQTPPTRIFGANITLTF